jgi:hypothetical protein
MLAHSPPTAHDCAFFFLQRPRALQVFVPVQVSVSSALVTGAHTPGFDAVLHAWHVPHPIVSQHTPSTQKPVSQYVDTVQLPPRVWYSQVSPSLVNEPEANPPYMTVR